MIWMVGALVGADGEGREGLVNDLPVICLPISWRHFGKLAGGRRVYFEEWDDPMISGIGWVFGADRFDCRR